MVVAVYYRQRNRYDVSIDLITVYSVYVFCIGSVYVFEFVYEYKYSLIFKNESQHEYQPI